jgi:hypothetical protein
VWNTFFSNESARQAVPDVPTVPPPPPPPWLGKPQTLPLLLACQKAIEATRTVPGYELESVFCSAAGASANYKRHGGTPSWLPAGASVPNPDRATITVPLNTKLDVQVAATPLRADQVRRLIWAAAQSYALDNEVAEVNEPGRALPPPPVGVGLPVPANVHPMTVSLGGPFPPTVLAAVLTRIPALVIEEVSWQGGRWKAKGKAYVN